MKRMRKSWSQRFKEARLSGGSFTQDDRIAAEDWRQCAVGENLVQKVANSRRVFNKEGRWGGRLGAVGRAFSSQAGFALKLSRYDELVQLGCDFPDAVRSNDVDEAERIFARVVALSKMELKKLRGSEGKTEEKDLSPTPPLPTSPPGSTADSEKEREKVLV